MNKLSENNQATLVGEIKTKFEFSHEVYGEKFYRFELSVERFSGTKDVLPVVVSERLIDVNQNYTGEMMEIQGQFRSFNKHEGNRSRLLLFVFAREAKFMDKDALPVNQILLDGFTCKKPVYRTTPNGREIADVLLAVTMHLLGQKCKIHGNLRNWHTYYFTGKNSEQRVQQKSRRSGREENCL